MTAPQAGDAVRMMATRSPRQTAAAILLALAWTTLAVMLSYPWWRIPISALWFCVMHSIYLRTPHEWSSQ